MPTCSSFDEDPTPEDPSIDLKDGKCYTATSGETPDPASWYDAGARMCCCSDTGCTIPAHVGWTLGAKGASCSASCAAQSSICHQASHRAVNTKAEFMFALGLAGQTTAAQALTAAQYCSFPRATDPSVVLPAAANSMQYVGTASTCEAVPSGDRQRLCCCSPTGCAASGG